MEDVFYDIADGGKGSIVANTRGEEYYIKNPLPHYDIGSYIVSTLVEDENEDIYIVVEVYDNGTTRSYKKLIRE